MYNKLNIGFHYQYLSSDTVLNGKINKILNYIRYGEHISPYLLNVFRTKDLFNVYKYNIILCGYDKEKEVIIIIHRNKDKDQKMYFHQGKIQTTYILNGRHV